jgi:chloramphenicol 3-O-phosphotransferase
MIYSPQIILITGKMASGKSSVVDALMERLSESGINAMICMFQCKIVNERAAANSACSLVQQGTMGPEALTKMTQLANRVSNHGFSTTASPIGGTLSSTGREASSAAVL